MSDAVIAWFGSPGGARVLQTAIVPALAILVAGVLAALIARAAMRAVIRRSERAEASSAVAALVAAARAAADPEADRGTRRRAARLRAEADVRIRLLPLQGAEAAADWAGDRIDAIQQRAAEGSASDELEELRSRLVDWVRRPSRAKRIFAAPVATRRGAGVAERGADPHRAEHIAAQPDEHAPEAAEPEGSPPPLRDVRDPEAQPSTDLRPATPSTEVPGGAHPAPAIAASGDVPAWQRTRAGGRLQQEHTRGRATDAPTDDDEMADADSVPESTAPVQLQHAHRAREPLTAGADEAAQLEAHQPARHARPDENRVPSISPAGATGTVSLPPAATPPSPVSPIPAWLDTYDDEAQVTQNLDLKTPPPVSAASVRDRGTPGEDLVPRS